MTKFGQEVLGKSPIVTIDPRLNIPLREQYTEIQQYWNANQVAIELQEVFSWQITIQLVCADAGYRGELGDWLYLTHQCRLAIAPPLGQSGVCGCPIALDCGAHLFLVRLVSPIERL